MTCVSQSITDTTEPGNTHNKQCILRSYRAAALRARAQGHQAPALLPWPGVHYTATYNPHQRLWQLPGGHAPAAVLFSTNVSQQQLYMQARTARL
jgi:hypothetical protein